jgi:hypothetical protein
VTGRPIERRHAPGCYAVVAVIAIALTSSCSSSSPDRAPQTGKPPSKAAPAYLYYNAGGTTSTGTAVDIVRIPADGSAEPQTVARVTHACGGSNLAARGRWLVRVVLTGGYCDQPPVRAYSASIVRQSATGGPSVTLVAGEGFIPTIAVSDDSVYWIERATDEIRRIPLRGDASSSTVVRLQLARHEIAGPITVHGSALYFLTCTSSKVTIGSASLDGKTVDPEIASFQSTFAPGRCPRSLAANDRHIYWAFPDDELRSKYIGRASVDGSNIDQRWLDTRTWVSGWLAASDRWVFWGWGHKRAHVGRVGVTGSWPERRFARGGGVIAVSS